MTLLVMCLWGAGILVLIAVAIYRGRVRVVSVAESPAESKGPSKEEFESTFRDLSKDIEKLQEELMRARQDDAIRQEFMAVSSGPYTPYKGLASRVATEGHEAIDAAAVALIISQYELEAYAAQTPTDRVLKIKLGEIEKLRSAAPKRLAGPISNS